MSMFYPLEPLLPSLTKRERILDYLGGSNLITNRSLEVEKLSLSWAEEDVIREEWLQKCNIADYEEGEGVTGQGMQAASRSQEGKEMSSPLESQ